VNRQSRSEISKKGLVGEEGLSVDIEPQPAGPHRGNYPTISGTARTLSSCSTRTALFPHTAAPSRQHLNLTPAQSRTRLAFTP